MEKTTKVVVGVIIILLVIVGIYVAARKNNDRPDNGGTVRSEEPYKIGVLLPLTGDGAAYGEPGRNIIAMATDEINNSGGINGTKLEMVYEDAKCNGKDAASAAQKLVDVEKVKVILGGMCSSESLAAVPIAAAAKVAVLSSVSSSPALTGISPYFARNYPSDDYQGTVLAEQAIKQGWKKVAIIQEQTDYSAGLNKAFVTKFESLGGQVIREEFPSSMTDFRSSLTKLRSENPNALFLIAQTPASGSRVLRQIQDLAWQPQLILSDALISEPEVMATYKDVLEGGYAALFGTDPGNQKFRSLLENYKNKYGIEMTQQTYGQAEYDAVYMLKDALAAVGYDGEKLAKWFRSVNNWPGASGSITINSNGDRTSGHQPLVIRNGTTEPIAR